MLLTFIGTVQVRILHYEVVRLGGEPSEPKGI